MKNEKDLTDFYSSTNISNQSLSGSLCVWWKWSYYSFSHFFFFQIQYIQVVFYNFSYFKPIESKKLILSTTDIQTA